MTPAQKILSYLNKKKKVKPDLIYTRKQVWEYLGESRQTFYTRIKKHNWTDVNRYALQELLGKRVVLMRGADISSEIEAFLVNQKKKRREMYWTRKDMAKHLGMSISLLYKRFDKNNWTDEEILKIDEL